jgi:hypothetical protein
MQSAVAAEGGDRINLGDAMPGGGGANAEAQDTALPRVCGASLVFCHGCRGGNGVAAFLREIHNGPDRQGDAPGEEYRAKSDPSGGERQCRCPPMRMTAC